LPARRNLNVSEALGKARGRIESIRAGTKARAAAR
jgi:hypothetical protein